MRASCSVHHSDVMTYETLIVVPTYQESANIDVRVQLVDDPYGELVTEDGLVDEWTDRAHVRVRVEDE